MSTLVLGGGHNALVAAAMLARSGHNVTVLDPRGQPGGLCAPVEFSPGFRAPGVLQETRRLRPWVVSALNLEQHGLKLRDAPPLLLPEQEGAGLLCDAGELPPGWKRYRAFVDKVGDFVRDVLDTTPPSIGDDAKIMPLVKRAVALRRMGEATMMELLRVGPQTAEDWLSETIESPLLRAAIAGQGLRGAYMGPISPSGATLIMLDACASGQEVEGGPAALISALLKACQAAGVTLRQDARVERIQVQDGEVKGVVLQDGSELSATHVVSALDPVSTLRLVPPRRLPDLTRKDLHTLRTRGTQAVIQLGIKGPLRFASRPDLAVERAWVGEHPLDLERAFDDARHRRMPRNPPLDLRVPSVSDPTLAPDGCHVVTVTLHCAAHDLDGGWTDAQREALGDTVVSVLERYAPGFTQQVQSRSVLTPADLEQQYGMGQGQLFGAESALEQLWVMRPLPRLARYRTGIVGLYLGGPAMHPMGGVNGGPGGLAARELLADQGAR